VKSVEEVKPTDWVRSLVDIRQPNGMVIPKWTLGAVKAICREGPELVGFDVRWMIGSQPITLLRPEHAYPV